MRFVSDMFGGGNVGGLEGDKLNAFNKGIGDKVMKGLASDMSFGEAFSAALEDTMAIIGDKDDAEKAGKLSAKDKELYDALGEGGRELVRKKYNESKDKNSAFRKELDEKGDKRFFAHAANVVNRTTNEFRKDAVSNMNKLLKGEALTAGGESLDGDKAIDEFARQAETLGLFNGPDGEIDEEMRDGIVEEAKKAYAEGNDTKAALSGMLKHVMPKGARGNKYAAAAAAGGKKQAAINMAASEMEGKGQTFDDVLGVMDDGTVGYVQALDDAKADATQNAVVKTVAAGGSPDYYSAAVKQTEEEITNLREALTIKDDKGNATNMRALVETAFGDSETDPDKRAAAKTSLEGALKQNKKTRGQADKYMAMLEELASGEHEIGGQKGMDVLFDKDAMEKAKKEKSSGDDLVKLQKESSKRDSTVGKIGDAVQMLLELFAKFSESPVSVILDKGSAIAAQ